MSLQSPEFRSHTNETFDASKEETRKKAEQELQLLGKHVAEGQEINQQIAAAAQKVQDVISRKLAA
jgi:hypothetical protein